MKARHEKFNIKRLVVLAILLIVAGLMIPYYMWTHTAHAVNDEIVQNEIAQENDTNGDVNANNFTALNALFDDAQVGGTITLQDDYAAETGESCIYVPDKNLTIDLNGHTINANKNTGTIFYILAVNFTISDSKGSGTVTGGTGYNYSTYTEGGAILNLGNLTITGGTFTGNSATHGGAISNLKDMTITGGNVSVNSAEEHGGGIYSYNADKKGNLYIGGTVKVNGNTVKSANNNIQMAPSSSLNLIADKPLVSGANVAITANAGILIKMGASDSTLLYLHSDNSQQTLVYKDGQVWLTGGNTFTDLKREIDNASEGKLTLEKDYLAIDKESQIQIFNDIEIDLNGHTIDACGKTGAVFFVNGGNLTINDSSNNEGVITGGTGYYWESEKRTEGGAIFSYAGKLTINGGTFTNNKADRSGAIGAYTNVEITGGVFTNNTATEKGGALFVYNSDLYGTSEKFFLGGDVVIKDNYLVQSGYDNNDQISNNIDFETDAKIFLLENSPFSSDAEVGVSGSKTSLLISSDQPGLDEKILEHLVVDDAELFELLYIDNEVWLVQHSKGNTFTDLWLDILAARSGTFTLQKDYKAVDKESTIFLYKDVVIDLNGHKIDADEKIGTIFFLWGCHLTINDSSNNEGSITGGTGYYWESENRTEGGAIFSYSGKVTVNGGTFTKNKADRSGVIGAFTDVEITGGVFTNNIAKEKGGCHFAYAQDKFFLGGDVLVEDNYVINETNANDKIVNNIDFESGAKIELMEKSPFVTGANVGITAPYGKLINSGATKNTLKNLCTDEDTKFLMFSDDNSGSINVVDETTYLPVAKQDAIDEINAKAKESKSKLEKNAAADAVEAIESATNVKEVNNKRDEGINDIEKAKEIIEKAIQEINDSLGPSPSEESKAVAQATIADINNADTIEEVQAAKEEGVFTIVKQNAIDEINAKAKESKSQLEKNAATEAIDAIKSATSVEEIKIKKDEGIIAMEKAKEIIEKAIQEINDSLGPNPSEESKAAAQTAIDSILNAKTVEEVQSAKEEGLRTIASIQQKEQSLIYNSGSVAATGDNTFWYVFILCFLIINSSIWLIKLRKFR